MRTGLSYVCALNKMAFLKEFRTLSCFLLLIFVAIHEGNADQQRESEKSLDLSRKEVEIGLIHPLRKSIGTVGKQSKLNEPLSVFHQRELRTCTGTQTPDGTCGAIGDSLEDLHNCAIFYRCEDDGTGTGTPKPICYTCPAGYLFNPDINECVANYVCSKEPACTTAGEVFPDKDNCAGFLLCLTGTGAPAQASCPTGQLFNVATNGCDDAGVNCNGRPVCIYEGQTLPSVYNCGQYYQCDAALIPQEKSCPSGENFDTDTNTCRSPPLANCAQVSRTLSSTSRDSSSERLSKQSVLNDPLSVFHQRELRTCTVTETPDGTCTAIGDSLEDQHSCAIFYRCEDDGTGTGTPKPICYTCPAGYLFNPDINECVANYVCSKEPACTTAGEVFPDKDNCAGFLLCLTAAGPPAQASCPTGQLFNVATNGCDDAGVNCNGRPVCLYEGETLPSVYNCGQYYQCDAALIPQEKSCPSGENFDTDTNTCRSPPLANCAEASRTLSSTSRDSSSERLSFRQSLQRELRSCASGGGTEDGTCTDIGDSLPDQHDCAVFYRCEDDGTGTGAPTPICYTCPAGMLFNPDINECDENYYCTLIPVCTTASEVFPNKDNCAGFYICLTATGTATEASCPTGQLFNVESHGCDDSAIVDCNGRPVCKYEGETLPSVYYCEKYYQCDAALIPEEQSCPAGDFYDTDTNTCRAPALANCAEAPSTVTTSTPDVTTDGSKCIAVGQRYPDPYDCSAYYECGPGLIPSHHFCPTGQLFDDASGLCQAEGTVTCTVSTFPTIETTTGGSSTECSTPGQVIYSPTDCKIFYACDAGLVPRAHACNPASQLYYDPAYGNCNLYTRVTCSNGVRPQPTPTAIPITGTPAPPATVNCLQPGQFIPNTQNCASFYKCSQFLFPELFSCPPNLLFHSATGCCDTSQYAVCATK